jgi:hypothetical protein
VGANGEGGHLFEAIADSTPPPAHPARLTPQISELFDFGLYGVGQIVREAVTRFIAARRAKLWLDRRNGAAAPWNLRISDSHIGRLTEENSRSAGLGLAIAALCQAFGRDVGVIFATGEVVLPSTPGVLSVSIGPVGGMRGKLALIGDYFVQHRKWLAGRRLILALPRDALDGRPLADAEGSTLGRLASEAAGIGANLEIAYLGSLDELEATLGPFLLPEFVTPRRAFAAAAVALALGALGYGVHWAARAPIELAFVATSEPTRSLNDSAAPRRARYDNETDKLNPLAPCFDAQREPLVVGGETLIFRVSARDAWPWVGRWRPPRLFVASVSRAADPVILDAARFKAVGGHEAPGSDLTAAIPVEPVEDQVRLFIIATRDPALDASHLQADLRAALRGLSGAAVLTTTTSYLADRLGNVIDYEFKVTNDASACPA